MRVAKANDARLNKDAATRQAGVVVEVILGWSTGHGATGQTVGSNGDGCERRSTARKRSLSSPTVRLYPTTARAI